MENEKPKQLPLEFNPTREELIELEEAIMAMDPQELRARLVEIKKRLEREIQ